MTWIVFIMLVQCSSFVLWYDNDTAYNYWCRPYLAPVQLLYMLFLAGSSERLLIKFADAAKAKKQKNGGLDHSSFLTSSDVRLTSLNACYGYTSSILLLGGGSTRTNFSKLSLRMTPLQQKIRVWGQRWGCHLPLDPPVTP